MAISCIRNQPIDFCTRLECYDEAFCIRQLTTDVTLVQVGLSERNGNELVTNGDFSAAGTWTYGTNWAYDGTADEADATAATSAQFLSQSIAISNGGYYRVAFEVKNWVNGLVRVTLGGTVLANIGANGSYVYYGLASNVDTLIKFSGGATNFTGSIDNVSVIQYTTIGIRILDCETDDIAYEDYDNSDGFITYFSGVAGQPMAQIEFDWADMLSDLETPVGCWCICLVEESDQVGCTLRSQSICVATSHPGTMLFTASQDANENFDLGGGQYLNYSDFTFQMRFRCEALMRAPHWEEDYENYQFSDFARKTVKFSAVEVLELNTEELPVSQIRALVAMAGHDSFQIDGVQYHKFGAGVSPEWPKGTDHGSFSIEIVEDSKGLKNSNC